jgi:hypothetical protein
MSKLLLPSDERKNIGTGDLVSLASRPLGPAEYGKLEPFLYTEDTKTYGEGLSIIREKGFERYLSPAEAACLRYDLAGNADLPGDWKALKKTLSADVVWVSTVVNLQEGGKAVFYENISELRFVKELDHIFNKSLYRTYYSLPDGSGARPAASFEAGFPTGDTVESLPAEIRSYLFNDVPIEAEEAVSRRGVYLGNSANPRPLVAHLDSGRLCFIGSAEIYSEVLGVRARR